MSETKGKPPNKALFGVNSDLYYGLGSTVLLVVFLTYLQNYHPIPEFREKLFSTLFFIFLFGGLFNLGFLINSFFSLYSLELKPDKRPILYFCFLFGLGFSLFGTLILILGWAIPGNLRIKLGLMTGLLAFVWLWGEYRKSSFISYLKKLRIFPSNGILVNSLIVLGLVFSFLSSYSPITYYDSLVYHLALPSQYLIEGSIKSVPFNLYSYFPALGEMNFLYLLAQAPEPEYVINLLGWLFAFLIGVLLVETCDSTAHRGSSRWALLMWWTMPAVLLLSVGGYVDIPLAFFTFLSFIFFTLFWSSNDHKYIVWTAFAASAAVSIKYTGGSLLLIFSIFILFHPKINLRVKFKRILILTSVGLVFFLPWLIKNFITIKNPVFPFLYSTFGGNVGWSSTTASHYFQMLTQYGSQSSILIDLFKFPWEIGTKALKFGGGFDVLGDFGWPPLLYGTLLSLFFLKEQSINKLLLFLCLSYLAIWYISKPVLRFLVPLAPVMIVLSSQTIQHILDKKRGAPTIFAVFIFFIWIPTHLFAYGILSSQFKLHHVPLGIEQQDRFFLKRLPFRRIYDWVNEFADPSNKILILGEQRTYGLKIPFMSSNYFAPSQLSKWANEGKNSTDLQLFFNENKIEYIFIHLNEIHRLGGLEKFGFNKNGIKIFNEFLNKNTETTFDYHGMKLLKVI